MSVSDTLTGGPNGGAADSVERLSDMVRRLIVDGKAVAGLHANAVTFNKLALLAEVIDAYRRKMRLCTEEVPFSSVFHAFGSDVSLAAEAERCCRAVLAQAPNLAEAHYGLACLLRARGEVEPALDHLRRAILWPAHPGAKPHAMLAANAYFDAGELLAATDRPDQAEAAFSLALQRLDRFGVAHQRLAAFYRARGHTALALEHYDRCMGYAHRYHPQFIPPDFKAGMPAGSDMPPLQFVAEDIAGYAFVQFGWEILGVPRVLLPLARLEDFTSPGGKIMALWLSKTLSRLLHRLPDRLSRDLRRRLYPLVGRYVVRDATLEAVRRRLCVV